MKESVRLEIPFATMVKVALFILLCLIIIRLSPVIVMIIVASLIAVLLDPAVQWMEGRGMRRGLGIAVVTLCIVGLVIVFVIVVVPITVNQTREIAIALPRLVQDLSNRVPSARPYLAPIAEFGTRPFTGEQLQQWLTSGIIAGRFAISALTALILTLAMSIYLLVEGRLALEWLIVFAHGGQRDKLRRTLREIRPIIFAYMRGQAIDCTLCGTTALVTLTLLHIPAAVPLAVLAAVADIVPVVGTIVMIIPAVLLALVVSPAKAFIVLAVYLGYHIVESYVIIPRVFGRQMRLSDLTVLLTVIIGIPLLGALGAMLLLPLVAAYPVIEEVWLHRRLGSTVEEHERLEER